MDNVQYYTKKINFNFQGTPIYRCGTSHPIIFCLHGAGDSAMSFACLAKEVSKFATLISFDYRVKLKKILNF